MNSIQAKIPKDWSEVTIGMFEQLQDYIKTLHKDDNTIETNIHVMSILSGLPYDTLKCMDIHSYNELNKRLSWMNDKPKLSVPKDKFTLNGKEYTAYLGPKTWTAAMFIDFKTVSSSDTMATPSRIISCFMTPKGKTYGSGYDPDEVWNDIKESMSVQEALSLSNFFTLQFRAWSGAILASLEKKLHKSLSKEIPEQELNSLMEKLKNARDSISAIGHMS